MARADPSAPRKTPALRDGEATCGLRSKSASSTRGGARFDGGRSIPTPPALRQPHVNISNIACDIVRSARSGYSGFRIFDSEPEYDGTLLIFTNASGLEFFTGKRHVDLKVWVVAKDRRMKGHISPSDQNFTT